MIVQKADAEPLTFTENLKIVEMVCIDCVCSLRVANQGVPENTLIWKATKMFQYIVILISIWSDMLKHLTVATNKTEN